MNRSRPLPTWCTSLAAAALAALAGCAATPPTVPAALATGPHEVHAMTLAAEGVQIYECRLAASGTPSWTLVAPEARLFDRQGRHVGHHGAGPHWMAHDGSRIDGQPKARADAPAPDAIPWLLLVARASGPRGVLSEVTSVQRVNTSGGKAPDGACSEQVVGNVVRVPYRADYRMFVRGKPSGTAQAASY